MVSRSNKSTASSPAAWAHRKLRQLVSNSSRWRADPGGGEDASEGAGADAVSQRGFLERGESPDCATQGRFVADPPVSDRSISR
jgi:hypothetical protein